MGLVWSFQLVRQPVVDKRSPPAQKRCSHGNLTLQTDVVLPQKVKPNKMQYGQHSTGLCPPARADSEQITDQKVKTSCQKVTLGHLSPNTGKQATRAAHTWFPVHTVCEQNW